MKNNLFKKVSAAALAGLMVLTFAPAASLTVFAANKGVEKSTGGLNVITSGAAEIGDNGDYVISGGGLGTDNTVTITGSATNVTIDLRGEHGTKIKFADESNKTAHVTIKSSTYQTVGQDKVPDVADVTITGVVSAASLSFDGNLVVSGDSIKLQDYLGSNPAVSTAAGLGYRFNIGTVTINTIAALGQDDIYAENGAVTVKGLQKGKKAFLDKAANVGTTLDVTAADDTSLIKVESTYNYKFYPEITKQIGSSTYKDVKYIAGASYFGTLFKESELGMPDAYYDKNTPANSTTAGVSISMKSLSTNIGTTHVISIPSYERAITLTQADKDKFTNNVKLPYVDNINDKGSKGARGITYFTKDPTAYVDAKSGIAAVDGTKYVVDNYDEKELEEVSQLAKTSVAILRGTSSDATAINALNKLHTGEDVKVTAPTSSSIVLGHVHDIGTKWDKTTDNGAVYGANHVEGVKDLIFGSAEKADDNDTLTTALVVPQVADGSYALVNGGATDTKVTLGNGVTYFWQQTTDQIADEKCNYVFGSVKDATNALNAVLIGKNLNTTNYFTKATAGQTVYVAKDIKGTFKGVNAKVNVLGEISSVKNADGSWTVNEGYASAAVPAYRMYRKSGEHVYTINPDEVTMLTNAGWINEGVAFTVNSVASKTGTPIYRLYNRNGGGMHFYTASAAERDMLLANGWTEGKEVFYGATKTTGIPVYRTYNTGSNNGEHNYTTNIAESDMNVKAGWRAEGVAFYVFK